MESSILDAALQQGLYAALFVALLWWVLRTNQDRERRYMEREDRYVSIISTLSDEIKERLTKVEGMLERDHREGGR